MKMKKMVAGAGLACLVYVGSMSGGTVQAKAYHPIGKKVEANQRVVNIAHRGASAYAPEHTMASYQLAKNINADYLEIDLQMTKDGQLIAMHDTTVDRTTNGTGRVKDLTLKEIKQLDAGAWFNAKYPERARQQYVGQKVPTLEEIFKKYGRHANYYIETKSPSLYPEMEKELLRLIDKYKLLQKRPANSVIIQSFSKESLLNIHQANPHIPLVQLLSYSQPATISPTELTALKQYATGVGMNYGMIDAQYIQQVRNAGLWVHPYTVNNREDMAQLIAWGVDGMFSDHPDQLKQVIREASKEKKAIAR